MLSWDESSIYHAERKVTAVRFSKWHIAPEAYADKFKELEGCEVYSIEQENGNYVISIDTEDHTFLLRISGSGDTQEWDRFLNK